jgi:hypothetical protein
MTPLEERTAALEAAMSDLAHLEFGDQPGHAFRGNQYTDGAGYGLGMTNGEPGPSSFLEGKSSFLDGKRYGGRVRAPRNNGQHSLGEIIAKHFAAGGDALRTILADGEVDEESAPAADD